MEVISLREENVKHFDVGNGTYQAIAYSHPVHEKDSEGNWQDIDFTMNLTQTRGVSTYTNTTGTAFAANYVANQPIMSIGSADTTITMTLLPNVNAETMHTQTTAGTTTVQAQRTATQTQIQTYTDAQAASFSNTLLYENVMPGIDLEYIVDPWTVKENIIVNQRAEQYSYRFKLDITGMYPVLQPDGSVFIYNNETDVEEYRIPAPYMYDADGNYSEAVAYALSGSEGTYVLTVTADASWINRKGGSFPVTIDPSYVDLSYSMADTYITSDEADTSHGSINRLWVRENMISYIKPPTPSIPANMELTWAALTVFYLYIESVTSGSVGVTAHRVMNAWDESLTWNQASNMSGYYGLSSTALDGKVTYANVGATPSNPKQIDFVITNAVQDWFSGVPNRGIGLKYVEGSTNKSVIFRSREGLAAYRPRITYQYGNIFNCIHYYDSTMPLTLVNRIPDAAEALNTAFYKQFGITIYTEGSPTLRSDLTDACLEEIGNPCVDDCGLTHHKDIQWIASQLSQELLYNNQRIAFWTDRPRGTYCNHRNGIHELLETNDDDDIKEAVTPGYGHVMIFMDVRPNVAPVDKQTAWMGITVIHEMAHTFGMDDRYEDGVHNEPGYQCVMEYTITAGDHAEKFYSAILSTEEENSKNAFCDECAAILARHISS